MMLPRIGSLAILVFLALAVPARADGPKPPPEVQRVLDHILQKGNYPEVYGGTEFRVQLRGWASGDVDGDGVTEVFLLVSPHYQTTAPIQIYRVRPDGAVQHLRERLAPGPLIRPDGQRLDNHEKGLGVDMTLEVDGPDALRKAVMKASQKGSVVAYRGFLHVDHPENDPQGLLDVTDRDEFAAEKTCEGIQLSQPDAIAVGKVAGAEGLRLVVLVGKEVYAYQFPKVSPEGFLEKKVVRFARPEGVVGVDPRPDGTLAFWKGDGAELEVRLPGK